MKNTKKIPETRNEEYGFWGTMSLMVSNMPTAWQLAIEAVSKATGEDFLAARNFLDSCQGRHFANTVLDGIYNELSLPKAIDAATKQWMNWRISRSASATTGIPAGLPYLTGFVIQNDNY